MDYTHVLAQDYTDFTRSSRAVEAVINKTYVVAVCLNMLSLLIVMKLTPSCAHTIKQNMKKKSHPAFVMVLIV